MHINCIQELGRFNKQYNTKYLNIKINIINPTISIIKHQILLNIIIHYHIFSLLLT